MAVNDLITVGATPLVVQAYWAAGGSDWFADAARARKRWSPAGSAPATRAGWPGAAARRRRWPASSRAVGSTSPRRARHRQPEGAAVARRSPRARRRDRPARLERHPRQRPEPGAQARRAAAAGLPDAARRERGADRASARRCSRRPSSIRRSPRRCSGRRSRPHYAANITGHGWRKLMRHPAALHLPHPTRCPTCPPVLRSSSSEARLDDARGLRHLQHGRGLRAVRRCRGRRAQRSRWRARPASTPGSRARVEAGPQAALIEPLGLEYDGSELGIARSRATAAEVGRPPRIGRDGPPRMEARPTGSGRERSSPNRCDQCRGQARHLSSSRMRSAIALQGAQTAPRPTLAPSPSVRTLGVAISGPPRVARFHLRPLDRPAML